MEKSDRTPFDSMMKHSMLDIFKESPLYQETIEEGIEQGQEQALLLFVELRFPSLLVQARQIIERGMSLQQLQALQKKLYPANTIEEARAVLQGA